MLFEKTAQFVSNIASRRTRKLIPFNGVRCFQSSQQHFVNKKDGNARFLAKNDFKYRDLFAEKTTGATEPRGDERSRHVSADLITVSNGKKKNRNIKHFELGYTGELVYGIHPVYLALKCRKRTFYNLFIKENLSLENYKAKTDIKEEIVGIADNLGLDVTFVGSRELNYLAPGVVHQGICLDSSPYPVVSYEEKDEELNNEQIPLWLVLNELLDPMNVGAVLRSAYYFGVDKIFLAAENSCRLSPTVSKASAGALEVLDIFELQNTLKFLQDKKRKGWDVICASGYKEDESDQAQICNLQDLQLTKPTILILGNEGKGMGNSLRSVCSHSVCIHPSHFLHCGIDSLNVSVAAGILLYHFLGKKVSPCQ